MARPLLYLLMVFAIGRTHELFQFMAPIRIVLVIGVACVISTLLARPADRQPVLAQREVRIVLALAGLALALLPFGVWPGGSLRFLLGAYSKVVIPFLLVVALATDLAVIRNLLLAVLVGVGLLGLFTIVDPSIVTSQEYAIERAYASASYDPNDVALIMACGLPLATLGALALRGFRRLMAATVAVICVVATIMTVSRGGFIGLMFVLVLLVRRMRSVAAQVLAALTIVVFLAVAVPGMYWNVMSTIWRPTGSGYVGRGISSRLDHWERGLRLFVHHPLTGVGIGMYHIADGLVYGRQGGWRTVHNSFLQVAAELGVLGAALFATLLVFSIGNARRAQRAARDAPLDPELGWIAAAAETSLYAFMVMAFALSQAYAPMLYFLVGVAAALRLHVEHRQRSVLQHDTPPRGPWVPLRAPS